MQAGHRRQRMAHGQDSHLGFGVQRDEGQAPRRDRQADEADVGAAVVQDLDLAVPLGAEAD